MPLILVVEQDEGVVARLRQTLGAEGGWRLQHVRSAEEAMQRVASEAPDLFVVSTRIKGASNLLGTFARRQGGPGTLALIPDGAAEDDPATAGYGADAALAPPVSGERVRQAIEQILHGDSQAASAPSVPGRQEPKLTSLDIFGDLVAEVEREAQGKTKEPQSGPAVSRAGAADQAAPADQPTPPAPGPRPPRRSRVDDDIERRLEQTLSGVFPEAKGKPEPKSPKLAPPEASESRPAAATPPARKTTTTRQSDVEALISKTLSGLESPRPKRPERPAEQSPDLSAILGQEATPKREPAKPQAPTPDARGPMGPSEGARPAEPPAFDLSDLEELARTSSWRRTRTPGVKPPEESAPASPDAAPVPERGAGAQEADEPPADAPPPRAEEPPAETAEPAQPPFTPQFADTIEEVPEGTGAVFVEGEAPPASPAPPTSAAPAAGDHGDQGVAFGQYRLQERIGVGGMAEVWKARMTGVEGFQKTVAIKKILPHLTDSSDFVEMFVDEAKLAAQLNHAHIIHIYDLGRIEGDYYIAMEYVEGENLRAILNAARERGRPLPVGLALHVAARLASALDYAHRKRDFEDQSLDLVHRDVSPQNVLIGYEGTIKLCDFGIVKAVSKTSHTRMGALKGKLQYMSPEQAWGRNVDGRSDIFSLGALLFEMLTGRRLFSGDSEMEVLEAVRECRIQAPGSLDPSVPDEVDEIVLKALAREPDERYQKAGELERQIEEVLVAMRPAPGQSELATYMHELFERGDKPAASAATGEDSSESYLSDLLAPALGAGVSAPRAVPADQSTDRPIERPAERAESPEPRTAAGTGTAAPARARAAEPGSGTSAGDVAASGGDGGPGAGAAAAPGSAPVTEARELTGTATGASAPVEAVEPVAEVEPEEGGGKGKGLLIAAIAAALLIAVLLFWFVWLPRMKGDGAEPPQETPTAEEAPAPATPTTPGNQPVTDASEETLPGDDAADGTAEAMTDGSAAAGKPGAQAATGAGTDAVPPEVEERLEEALARREEQLRKDFEAKQRELAARVEAAKARAAEPEEPEPAAAPAEDAKAQSPPTPKTRDSPPPASVAAPPASPETAEASRPTDDDGGDASPASAERQAGGITATGPPEADDGKAATPATTRETTPSREPAKTPERTSEPEPAPPPKPTVRVGQLVQLGPGVEPPQLVSFDKPEYPPIARRLRIQGEVVVGVLVDENGNVADARLERSVPQKVGINEAALNAARKAKYRPATKDGVRVKMWTTLKIPFRL